MDTCGWFSFEPFLHHRWFINRLCVFVCVAVGVYLMLILMLIHIPKFLTEKVPKASELRQKDGEIGKKRIKQLLHMDLFF